MAKNNKKEQMEAVMYFPKPVLGFTAFSGTGKTSLLVKLLAIMKLQGLSVAVIKQMQHDIDIDKPENDSFELKQAGADQVLITSDIRYVSDAEFGYLIEKLDLENIDVILVDGFGHLPFARIELHRPSTGNKLIFPEDKSVIAVASDEFLETGGLPLLDINVPKEIAGYINRWLRRPPQTAQSIVANSNS